MTPSAVEQAADRQHRDAMAIARAMAMPTPELVGPSEQDGGGEDIDRIAYFSGSATYPEPSDCGTATLSELGDVEYVADLIRPGRIHVVAAEEGTGKTYAMTELGIRMAVAGGAFAGTWPILLHGPVVYLSEMHPDDDWTYQQTVLDALGIGRSTLSGHYYRLDLNRAARGAPALGEPAWRAWFTRWTRRRGIRLAVFDTATGATQVNPWGPEIQQVFRDLRGMLEADPELAVVLVLHLKKPQGRGGRRISDVLGEWGRWCDVLVLLERDGADRTRISTHKRLRNHRRISATRSDGLLVEPQDITDGTPARKVSEDKVVAAIVASPGIGYLRLADELDVAKSTAENYVKALGDRVTRRPTGPKGAIELTVTTEPPSRARHGGLGGAWVVPEDEVDGDHPTTQPPSIEKAVGWAVTDPSEPDELPVEDEYPASAWESD